MSELEDVLTRQSAKTHKVRSEIFVSLGNLLLPLNRARLNDVQKRLSFLYRLPYDDIFGGVSAMTVDQFQVEILFYLIMAVN